MIKTTIVIHQGNKDDWSLLQAFQEELSKESLQYDSMFEYGPSFVKYRRP